MSWRDGAACLGLDTGMFETGDPANPTAVKVCAGCPVRRECFDDAVANKDDGFIRGGIPINSRTRNQPFPELVRCADWVCERRFVPWSNRKFCSEACQDRDERRRRAA